MQKIQTDDNSLTYRNNSLDQPYHTKAGGIVEAIEKHAKALKVWEKDSPVIFDVCSGLAYSAACALEEIRNHDNNSLVTIYLFENDREILEKILELPDTIEYVQDGVKHNITCYHHFKKLINIFLEQQLNIYQTDNLCIVLMFGDFQSTIEEVGELADYVFYAPFSPQVSPEMWTYDTFKILFDHTGDGGKLSTYSYAKSVRDALTQSGFKVEDGPTLGRRSPSVIAKKE